MIDEKSKKACPTWDRFENKPCGKPVESGFAHCQHHFVDASRRRVTPTDYQDWCNRGIV